MQDQDYVSHYGVKGQKWGVRKAYDKHTRTGRRKANWTKINKKNTGEDVLGYTAWGSVPIASTYDAKAPKKEGLSRTFEWLSGNNNTSLQNARAFRTRKAIGVAMAASMATIAMPR